MNETQFDIVKIMQGLGVHAQKFANSVKQPVRKIRRAYSSATYSQFKELNEADDMLEQMGV